MKRRFLDLTGKRFGYLTVIEFSEKSKTNQIYWVCRCDCGNIKHVTRANLCTNGVRSCGDASNCKYAFKIKSEGHSTHSLSHTKEYQIWRDMNRRCYDDRTDSYCNYGARGITVYEDWINNFKKFYDYLQTLPETREQFEIRTNKQASLDRIDVNGNYEPGNLRWIALNEQNRNQRNTVLNEQMVKYILWERYFNKHSTTIIKKLLIQKFNYSGSTSVINKVIYKERWINVNIDKEIAEYERFGTVHGKLPSEYEIS